MKKESKRKLRSLQEVQSNYQEKCGQAGHLQYTLARIQHDLAELNKALYELNMEAGEIMAEEQKAKEKAEAEKGKRK